MRSWPKRSFLPQRLSDSTQSSESTGYLLRWQIAELAARHRLPTVCENSYFIVAGGLVSYGWDYREIYGYGARYVDHILRGAQPKDLPVEQVSKFELVINLKTAKAMGVSVPEALLVRADKVIE
jgi:putative ABC transport system substrate-binding protein